MAKSLDEINDKIIRGDAVVLTAGEMTLLVRERGASAAASVVDVVTTATFGAMCSSGILVNTGHTSPRINFREAFLNGVPAYAGIAAVDLFLGATARGNRDDYGGAHVINDLVRGGRVRLTGSGHGSDCYPRKTMDMTMGLADFRSAELFNFRNAYQNYNVAVNTTVRTIRTYLGTLRPRMGNAGFSTAGEYSPLLNDPYFRTIGVGTRIFLGGGTGHVMGCGTQHDPEPPRGSGGIPLCGAGTLSVRGDLSGMNPRWLRPVVLPGYGVSLMVGIGVPIPVLDEEMASFTGVSDDMILSPVVDYGVSYPENSPETLGMVSCADLLRGSIDLGGRTVPAFNLSSRPGAVEIAETLRSWINSGSFTLTRPGERIPAA
ncbi:MAG: homocysteine biosynthesis protein [Candidatus Fermentibacteraceae bacterium]